MFNRSIICLWLMATFWACKITASLDKDGVIREVSKSVRHRILSDEDEHSPFQFWDGIAEDDHDLVIDHILGTDIGFFHQLIKEDKHVVVNILQNTRVIDTLVKVQDTQFVREVLTWLTLQGSKDLTEICSKALERLNLAALEPCQGYISRMVDNTDTLLLYLIEKGDWPMVSFFVETGLSISLEVLLGLMAKVILSGERIDTAQEQVCNILQRAKFNIELNTTPLHVAAGTNKAALVRCLIDEGYNPHSRGDGGDLALDVALLAGNVDMTWDLLQAMIDHEAVLTSENGSQALRESIYSKDAATLENLVLSEGQAVLPTFLQDAHRMVGLAIMMRRSLLREYFMPLLENNHSPLREHVDNLLVFTVPGRDINLALSLLQQGVEVSRTAVFQAVARDDMEMLSLLLKSSTENQRDVRIYKETLTLCVGRGNVEGLRIFYDLGYDLMDLYIEDSLLHVAASWNQVQVLRFLLSLPGADIDLQDAKGVTPLISSALAAPQAEEAMNLLLELGADPSIEDRRCRTALVLSAQLVGESTVKALLKHGAPLHPASANPVGSNLDVLPLARAMLGSEGILRLLLEAGAGRELLEANGVEPFVRSVFHCHKNDICADDHMIRVLFKFLQPLLSSEHLSHLFLWNAVTSERTKLLRYFLEEGVDLNVMTDDVLPVDFAAMNGYCASMDLLVEFGAFLGANGMPGSSTLSSALKAKQVRAALRLRLRHGVEPDEFSSQVLQGLRPLLDFMQTVFNRNRIKRAVSSSDQT